MVRRPEYQVFHPIHLVHHSESWGNAVWNKFLVTEYMDEDLVVTASTDFDGTNSLKFLYSPLVQGAYYLEGIAHGHFTLTNTSGTATVTGYTVNLSKLDDAGNYTSLGTVTNTIAAGNTIAVGGYLTLPIRMIIAKAAVNANEKIVLSISIVESGTSCALAHDNDSTENDCEINIPFAPTG